MHQMGDSEQYIQWVNMLFGNAFVVVNLNGSPGEDFRIERGVHQGCPLLLDLFLIFGGVLMHIFKKAMADGD